MIFRGMFEKIFGNNKPQREMNLSEWNFYGLLNSFENTFSLNTGAKWDMNVVRRAVDAYARNFAKLKAKHVAPGIINKSLERILQMKPNPLMEAYSFYYKIAVNLKLTNNAFIYPEYGNNGKLIALYPIQSNQIQLLWFKNDLYIKFMFATGRIKVVLYEALIHLRGHYYDHDILGSDNVALDPAIALANAVNKGVEDSSKLINRIRGILHAKTTSKDEDLKAARDKFVQNNLTISNNGSGVIVTDAKLDYTPIEDKSTPLNKDYLNYTKDEIYDYFGVNESIVKSTFDDTGWNAFYEGSIEPVAIQMSQCFTNVLFTKHEQEFGNEIIFESNRLQYMSVPTKTSFVKEIAPMGCLMKDEIREIFNMAPLPNGEGQKVIQSLNWINAAKADEYQIGVKGGDLNGSQNNGDKSQSTNGENGNGKDNGTSEE